MNINKHIQHHYINTFHCALRIGLVAKSTYVYIFSGASPSENAIVTCMRRWVYFGGGLVDPEPKPLLDALILGVGTP